MTPAQTISWLHTLPRDFGEALAQFIVDTKATDEGYVERVVSDGPVVQHGQQGQVKQHEQGGLW